MGVWHVSIHGEAPLPIIDKELEDTDQFRSLQPALSWALRAMLYLPEAVDPPASMTPE